MNIIDAQRILVAHFIKNDSITSEQFKNVCPKKTPDLEAEAAFSHALNNMENNDLVAKFIGGNKDKETVFTWVLKRPIMFNKQSIIIDSNIALEVANIVNDFFKQSGDTKNICNPLQISQDDIKILMEIINILAAQNVKNIQNINNKEEAQNE